jgi:hypothetical protein
MGILEDRALLGRQPERRRRGQVRIGRRLPVEMTLLGRKPYPPSAGRQASHPAA